MFQTHTLRDNKADIDSFMTLHWQLNKRHTALSFRCVKETICPKRVASGVRLKLSCDNYELIILYWVNIVNNNNNKIIIIL